MTEYDNKVLYEFADRLYSRVARIRVSRGAARHIRRWGSSRSCRYARHCGHGKELSWRCCSPQLATRCDERRDLLSDSRSKPHYVKHKSRRTRARKLRLRR
jgi:hypothetical protein